ncbi:S-adenosyl-L-methionine-dependent tRNA 4-demethylwyosine synthase [Candidatus Anstonella stagnisolia]|nr:S-adenosyl-L-methionine-dependent tRNA 4-demethylwyosine synthase [Candidatus Anstonella stagnisolia]
MARRRKKEAEKTKYFKEMREQAEAIPQELLKKLLRQKYHIVGKHSAVKMCQWTASTLKGEGSCYKNAFYGIQSHQCIQSTPVLLFCNHACVFCWRMMPEEGLKFSDMPKKGFSWDAPKEIVEGFVQAHRKTVSGFGGNPKTGGKVFEEANSPKHVALSLTGEPSMYPYMGELLEEFHKRGISTFLVTNGTYPNMVEKWKTLPTQLYVSLVAPNKEVYLKAIRPDSPVLWEQYLKTLEMLPELGKKTRTVLRMTLVRDVNMQPIEGYAQQILLAKPHYVEVKSMVFVGGARLKERGLSTGSMLGMEEIREYAKELAKLTGYIYAAEHAPSRIVLLCKDEKALKSRMIDFSKI